MNKYKKYLSILLVILWMSFIFIMSSYDSNESSQQSGLIVGIITNIFNISNTDILSHIIRKLAHFTEYFILGILVINMLKYLSNKYLIISIIICILYAISDEIHQLYVPGRSCQITDILIDSIGSILGISIFKKITKN